MRRHELFGGVKILVLLPALGEHEFFVRRKHRKLADFFQIPREAERTAGQ